MRLSQLLCVSCSFALCFALLLNNSSIQSAAQQSSEIPPTHTPTLTPTPTPTPKCELLAVNFKHGAGGALIKRPDGSLAGDTKHASVDIDQTQGQAGDFSCVEEIITTVLDANKDFDQKLRGFGAGSRYTRYGFDLIKKHVTTFTKDIWTEILKRSGMTRESFYPDKDKWIVCSGRWGRANGVDNAYTQFGGGADEQGKRPPGCTEGTLYVDRRCNLVPVSPKPMACANMSYTSEVTTPISLIWDASRDYEPSVVSFKLRPDSSHKAWMWRGSDARPLVVIDAGRDGKITSATQLMGSWAFGGRAMSDGSRVAWRDGFEALRVLDHDGSGSVEGEELDKLALWFDGNRDGISQPGEVKSLAESKVVKLFYHADKIVGPDRIATRGFERIIDGKVEVGSSIDWAEREIQDDAALHGEHVEGAGGGADVLSQTQEGTGIDPRFVGLWRWQTDGPRHGAGYLVVEPYEDGARGVILSEFKLADAPTRGSAVLFSNLKISGGNAQISFKVGEPQDVSRTTVAELSPSGDELLGKTVVANSSLSATGTYEYKWTATRLR